MRGTTNIFDQDKTGKIEFININCDIGLTYQIANKNNLYAFFPQLDKKCNLDKYSSKALNHKNDIILLYKIEEKLLISYNNNDMSNTYRDKVMINNFIDGSFGIYLGFNHLGITQGQYVAVGDDSNEQFTCSQYQDSILAGLGGINTYFIPLSVNKLCTVIGNDQSSIVIKFTLDSNTRSLKTLNEVTTSSINIYGLKNNDIIDISAIQLINFADLSYQYLQNSTILNLPNGLSINLDKTEAFLMTIDGANFALYNSSTNYYTTNFTDTEINITSVYEALKIAYVNSIPSEQPSGQPIELLSVQPTGIASGEPSGQPTTMPSNLPITFPSAKPSFLPSLLPSSEPSAEPSGLASLLQALTPTSISSHAPTIIPSTAPIFVPSFIPISIQSAKSSDVPSAAPTVSPSDLPTIPPTTAPTVSPTIAPSVMPTVSLTKVPSVIPILNPTANPSISLFVTQAVTITNGGTHMGTKSSENFIIDSTSDTTITGGGGSDVYTPIPHADVTITITDFNTSSDKINLQLYSISEFSEVNITSGSIIITLEDNQKMRLLNLTPRDIDENNFVFDNVHFLEPSVAPSISVPDNIQQEHQNSNDLIIGLSAGIAAGVIILGSGWWIYNRYSASNKIYLDTGDIELG